MGQVIYCGGGARDPSIHNLLQIADVDPGVIRLVNADLVSHILPTLTKCHLLFSQKLIRNGQLRWLLRASKLNPSTICLSCRKGVGLFLIVESNLSNTPYTCLSL